MSTIDKKTRSVAMLVSSVMFRAFVLGAALLFVSCVPILLLTDQIYGIHNSMIEIPRSEYNALIFNWLGNLKLLLIVFFLLPAIAIRWRLRRD